MNNQVVIMAGGIGSRFWPLSTPEFPKQFIDILGCGRTLIQLTVDRFKGVCPMSNFWVVTNAAYVDIVRQQLPDMPAERVDAGEVEQFGSAQTEPERALGRRAPTPTWWSPRPTRW